MTPPLKATKYAFRAAIIDRTTAAQLVFRCTLFIRSHQVYLAPAAQPGTTTKPSFPYYLLNQHNIVQITSIGVLTFLHLFTQHPEAKSSFKK